MRLPDVWGATPAERALVLPVDDVLTGPVRRLDRAVDVAAPPALVWRWVGQLTLAPYSYDLIDNRGRRSPPRLTPGTEPVVGGRIATVFDVLEVAPGRSVTGRVPRTAERWFGPVAVTYAVHPAGAERCRLHLRFTIGAASRWDRLRAAALAWGDLPMARKQLLTLRRYAERDHRTDRTDCAG